MAVLPTAPGAPDAVVIECFIWLSILAEDPPIRHSAVVIQASLPCNNLTQLDVVVPSSEVDQLISYSNQTVRWGYKLYDVAETTYRFSVQASTIVGFGPHVKIKPPVITGIL